MPESNRSCLRCGEVFVAAAEELNCPRCDNQLNSWIDNPTLDLEQTDGHPAVDQDRDHKLVGETFANYQIDAFLGQGGMARVYLGTHLSLQRPCAIKLLKTSTQQRDEQSVQAFLNEARLSAALNHPHAVTLYTIGNHHGQQYLEMEYVDGKSLGCLVREQGAMDALAATKLMYQISAALAAAHDLEMIHRDIKPANVMVTHTQVAKLADFGLAKQVASEAAGSGEVLSGTPQFMAPELFAGHRASMESDIYAMGVTFFSLLTARLPVENASLKELIQFHSKDDVVRILDAAAEKLPPSVSKILRKALTRNVRDRYRHASELRDDLRAAVGGLRSIESMLNEALAGTSMRPEAIDGYFRIRVQLADGRNQTVTVENGKDAETGEEIIRFFSVCGPTSTRYYERALQLNAAMSHGAIGIEAIDGAPHFVMVNAYPRATCDPHEIRTGLAEVAKYADQVEHLLTGEDRF